MADFEKCALFIIDQTGTKFLVTRKKDIAIPHWLMPGGKIEAGETIPQALKREIKEELGCDLDTDSLEFVGEYEAPAAGPLGKVVNIKLYRGAYTGKPKPSAEILELGWLSKNDINNPIVSEIIRTKIMPDLIRRGILK